MMNRWDESNSAAIQYLEALKINPPRDLKTAQRGRAKFLNQASEIREAVSNEMMARHKIQNLNSRKELRTMNILVSVLLAAAVLAGVGVTLASAQDDLPGEPLYEVRLLAEDISLMLPGSADEDVARLMELSQIRMQEIIALAEEGQTPPEPVLQRMELHIQQALETAAALETDTELSRTLLQLRERLQTQEQLLSSLQTGVNPETEPLLTRARDMLRTRLYQVDEGLTDPQGFRYAIQNEMQYGQDETITPGPNQQGEPGFHNNKSTPVPTDPVETETPVVEATPGTPAMGTASGNHPNGNGSNNSDNQGSHPEQGGKSPGGGGGNH